ncbi:Serine/threonine protein kinase [Hyphomicrobium sp. 1Nfss2.1]
MTYAFVHWGPEMLRHVATHLAVQLTDHWVWGDREQSNDMETGSIPERNGWMPLIEREPEATEPRDAQELYERMNPTLPTRGRSAAPQK